MGSDTDVVIIPASSTRDYEWLRHLWISKWGGEIMVSRACCYKVAEVQAFLAIRDGKMLGALSYVASGDQSECVTLNALVPDQGIGTALLNAWQDWARRHRIARLWLVTSNDNLSALAFYQRRGFRLLCVYPGAIDKARMNKPSIPLTGESGIPLHDEIELEKWIDAN